MTLTLSADSQDLPVEIRAGVAFDDEELLNLSVGELITRYVEPLLVQVQHAVSERVKK